ncbi:MAG: SUMF1/EgtB/PvdO family nonheme iron enzyme, partial [Planctomycetota bacterium]|nr:SUMF1/EgtB/PvdO family nonheme iron enzyme [Planctomycetota bacterium]
RNTLAGETPQHSVQVADFFLMVSEVTNEQYLEFVRTMGAKPPENWAAQEPFEAASTAFFEAKQAEKERVEAEGRRFVRGDPFDKAAWWEEHWRETVWDAPADKLDHPVTYVNYQDARAYATWAGLRLMTEFEYQCAVRGKTRNLFPWGDDWDDKKYCASIHDGLDYALPIGSFPAGAVNGLFDLAGNVWEWTSSPYVPYPGNKAVTVTIGKGKQARKVQGMAQWDANKRVAVGGSAKNPKLACRCTTRRTTDRFQTTDSLGFRCAASIKPGRDLAEVAWTEVLSGDVRPADVTYLSEGATIFQRWRSKSSEPAALEGTNGGPQPRTEAESDPPEPAAEPTPVNPRIPTYDVITGYDCVLFIPVESVDAINLKGLSEATVENGPAHVGIVHTTVPLLDPRLEPGTYMVAWRFKGELPEKEDEGKEKEAGEGEAVEALDEERPDYTTTPGFDDPEGTSYFFFYDATATPVACIESAPLLYDRMKEGRAKLIEWVAPPEPRRKPEGWVPPTPMDTVEFRVAVKGRQRNKGFIFDLPLKTEPGVVDADWR